MENNLNDTKQYKKSIVVPAILSVAFAILASFIGEPMLPFVIASLAALYLYDKSNRRLCSVVISGVIIVIGVIASIIFSSYVFILAIESALIGAIIAICYTRKVTKAATALFATAAAVCMLALSIVALGMIVQRSLSWDAVRTFYTSLYEAVKSDFIASYDNVISSISTESMGIDVSSLDPVVILDTALYMLIALIIIIAFAISGIALKLFCAYARRLDTDTSFVNEWKFVTPTLYAHFYIALSLLNIFLSGSSDVLGITIANLYLVFTVVYAYVGLKMLYEYFSAAHSKIVVLFLLAVILVCLPGTAIQIFSLIGVFYTFYRNKMGDGSFGGFTFGKK